ncbi:MAG: RelA/SpoT family protein [Gammaproteobacteria bacterium]|nr:RelA/SpoT family protein [Gammaproteobacteria bacterium]
MKHKTAPKSSKLLLAEPLIGDASVSSAFAELTQALVPYLSPAHIEVITQAFYLAHQAHAGQSRISGEPYISHPIAVAKILADMHMDCQSITAAILHDVIEDTLVDRATLAEHFGEEVAELVESVSKLDRIKCASRVEAQAENLRKMMLAMTRDIRVILIKLADRLHNMRTIAFLPREKKRRIAKETLEIYAPIANRLGMNSFRLEFEDAGFEHLYPMRHRVLKKAVLKARGNRKEVVSKLEMDLNTRLATEGIQPFTVMGREKHLYSLYKKMKKKDFSLSEIMDIYALRILVESVDTCYRVLGIVHNTYKPLHGRFKDYIAVPKMNGYQSLHTAVLGPHGVPIEVQIRTQEMHYLAEHGMAAHWLYKTPEGAITEAEMRAREWVQGILDIQKNTNSSKEFIEHLKINLYPDEVYVFTPGGDILSLPNHATAVDFAYAVHTDVGNACIAAKIDRRLLPLSTQLSSGQTVEIVTAAGAHPNPAWLSFVVTGKAKNNIRHFLRTQQTFEATILGKRLLERAMNVLFLSLEDVSGAQLSRVLQDLKLESFEQLCEAVGLGNQDASLVVRRFVADPAVEAPLSVNPLAIHGTEGMVVSYAHCCYPIPGDPVVGFLNSGQGVIVHRENCKNVRSIRPEPEKYIFVRWAEVVEGEFSVTLRVEVLNNRGILASLAHTLAKHDVSIQNVQIDERDSRHNVIIFLLSIKSRDHLAKTMRGLRTIAAVTRVSRGA